MSGLRIEPVETLSEAMGLRQLRNRCRSFMTHDQEAISEGRQQAWFEHCYSPARAANRMHAFLGHIADNDRNPVAFGLVNQKDGKYWLTGGVTPTMRGDGHGEAMFRYMTDYTLEALDTEVWLDVFADNTPARNLYLKLGYTAVAEEGELVIMVKTNE